jgi:cytochrome P450
MGCEAGCEWTQLAIGCTFSSEAARSPSMYEATADTTRPVRSPEPPQGANGTLPPGPRGLPLVGTAIAMARDPLAFLIDLGHRYGPVSFTRIGPWPVYMINDPELIEEVLVGKHRNCIKDKSTRDLMPLAGQGLLTSDGEPWLRQRRLAAPPLQPKRIAGYATTTLQCAERAFAALRDGESRDMHAVLAEVTLEIVGKTLLGVDARGETERIARALDLFMVYFDRQVYSWQGMLPMAVPTPSRVRMRRAVRDLDRIVYPMIARCRASEADADHLLARLVHARGEDGEPMSDLQLRDEALTMLLAGHETTALALTYSLFLLTTHPEALRKLQAEVDAAFAGGAPDPMALCALPYLQAVAREALRLYPPGYVIGREVVTPFELGGYTLERGAQLSVSPYTVQRDPRFFAEPERFVPERWLEPSAAELPRFAYFPFGGGPRVCIGNHFATMEVALVLATLLRRLEIEIEPGYQLRPTPLVTLRVAGGLPARIRLRRSGNENALRSPLP